MIDIPTALKITCEAFPKGPEALAAHLGISVKRGKLKGCDGWCIKSPAGTTIRLNESAINTRQRFTLAHELAHLVLGTAPSVLPALEWFKSTKAEEKAADQLAAEFLLPESQLCLLDRPITVLELKDTAKRAEVSELMAALRVVNVAEQTGRKNAVVACISKQKTIEWIWPNTARIGMGKAISILESAISSKSGITRIDDGEHIIVSSLLYREEGHYLFIQHLPKECGHVKTELEIIKDLDKRIFGDNVSLRSQVNGCLSAFKNETELDKLHVDQALNCFNKKYIGRWSGTLLPSPEGQLFLKLRLSRWCRTLSEPVQTEVQITK